MYKNAATGGWEHDFRFNESEAEGGPLRYHLSYGTSKKAEAQRLHGVAVALFKARRTTRAVIDAMRRGAVTLEQLAQLREMGEPFTKALERVEPVDAWPLFTDAAATYIEGLAQNQNRAAGTARVAEQELARFAEFLEATGRAECRLDEITSPIVEAYQAALIAAGYKQNTYTAYVSRVGSVFHWFIRREQRRAREERRTPRVLHVPLDPETITRGKTARLRYLSESEAQRLLAATPRQYLFQVAAGLFGGFRVDEMCHLRTEHDVDLSLGVLSVQRQPTWTPKTKRSARHVPIATVLRPVVEAHLERYASDEWMVPAVRDPTKPMNSKLFAGYFARIVEDADLVSGIKDPKGVTYHTLRHTFASWSLMKGTDVFTVAKLLGNTVQQIEETYGHLALDFRKTAVDRLSTAIRMPTFEDEPGEAPAVPSREPSAAARNSATTNATTEAAHAGATEGE